MSRPLALLAAMALMLALPACGSEGDGGEPASQQLGGTEALTARTLGTAYLEDGELEAAGEQFRRLVELAPDNPTGYASLARVALQSGDPAAALEQAERALERASGETAAEIRLLMAASHAAAGDTAAAREVLRELADGDRVRARALWELSRLSDLPESVEALDRLVEEVPANLAARMALAEVRLRSGDPSGAAAQLEELRQLAPEFPGDVSSAFGAALEAARAGRGEEALDALERFRGRYELTAAYQSAVADLRGPRGVRPGRTDLSFADGTGGGMSGGAGLRLRSATGAVGLDGAAGRILAAGDADGDEAPDLLVGARIYRNIGGSFEPAGSAAPEAPAGLRAGTFADLDNDGRMELVMAGDDAVRLYTLADGVPEVPADTVLPASLPVPEGARPGAVRVLDLDQDGDLDLFVAAGGRNLAYRNDGDGTFTELAGEMGLAGEGAGESPAAVFLDVEADGYLDLAVTAPGGGVTLYANQGHGRFEARGLLPDGAAGAGALAAGDVDHDGYPEIVASRREAPPVLIQNDGRGDLSPAGPAVESRSWPEGAASVLRVADLDNDGWMDLLAGGGTTADAAPALRLFMGGEGGAFTPAPGRLPEEDLPPVTVLTTEDFDADGDVDVAVAGSRGVAYLRNDGGNANNYLRLRLVGLRDGSGKNNHFGIGARVEVRAGDLYQMRTVEEAVTHIGLADSRRADVVRIVWPNGVPQVMYEARAEAAAAENQELKGSCAFLYAWNGQRFEMVTDVMWRSALGMPLGIMAGPQGARPAEAPASPARYASPAASREYVRIPPAALRARNGSYELRFTEELWEVAYADEIRLVAVDHPDSLEVFVDEAFRPSSAPANDELHPVTRKRPPVEARDGEGEDVLSALRYSDDVHVADLEPTRFQGLVEMHEIVLRAGEVGPDDRVRLLLEGWVFPTDASINVSIAQNPELTVVPPHLQVPDGDGGWKTVIPELSFPSGKEKTVVADLTGLLLPDDPRVRVRTNMQVYWDRASFAVTPRDAEIRRTAVHPHRAELHYRGFSREYRKGGRHGPHWFDYDSVSTEPRWARAITGRYTRYGDVRELLSEADSRSVVMAPGDEVELSFRSDAFPPLPQGWDRTFLLHSVGWIKDADLNTRTGQTVSPMPYHGMTAYPPPAGRGFTDDSARARYLREYQTRVVAERPSPLLTDGS